MSSVSISASGARALSTTTNDPARTFASMPTTSEDVIGLQSGGYGEATFLLIADRVELEQIRKSDVAYVRVTTSFLSGLQLRPTDKPGGGWPHASLDVRKGGLPDFYQDAERIADPLNLATILTS